MSWEGKQHRKENKAGKEDAERETHTGRLIDKYIRTQTQAKVTQPSPPPGTTNWW